MLTVPDSRSISRTRKFPEIGDEQLLASGIERDRVGLIEFRFASRTAIATKTSFPTGSGKRRNQARFQIEKPDPVIEGVRDKNALFRQGEVPARACR